MFLLAFMTQILLACSFFSSPKEHPVIDDRVGVFGKHRDFTTLAITPERRLVIFSRSEKEGPKICAQPSSDVAENLAATLAVMGKGSTATAGGAGTIQAQAEIAHALATTAKQLFLRSQGIQLFRDAMYSACQDYLNNAITPEQLETRYYKALDIAKELIMFEIPLLPQQKWDITVPAVIPPVQLPPRP
jgi:hypothetical protein